MSRETGVRDMRAWWRSVFPPVENPTLRILSDGGGVQSSTLKAMSAWGDCDLFDAAIMADTGDDEKAIWEYHKYLSGKLPYPCIITKSGDILRHIERSKAAADGKQVVTLPYYLADGGTMMRTCTMTLKINAVTQELRKMLGLRKGQRVPKDVNVEVCIGISTDEKQRAGGYPAEPWQQIRYILLEEGMNYANCVSYLTDRQLKVPPRSRCRICPYRSNESWNALSPADFEHACRVDEMLREGGAPRGFKSLPYLHRDRIPLRQVDLSKVDQFPQLECTGGCGS